MANMKKSFISTLAEMRGGAIVEDATTQLNDLVKAMQDTGKPGKIVLQIDIKPFAKSSDAVSVRAKVATTLPRSEDREEVFFATSDNNLSRNNERQRELPGVSLASNAA